MKTLVARRITSARRRGSSRPIIVDTDAGTRIVKLRGAGQGTGPLIAEIIVASIGEALGLFVPPRVLIDLAAEIETADWDDELADLLAASVGLNLGFDYLDGATDFTAAHVDRVPLETRATILWLDRLVLNPDRTSRNPNMIWWSEHLWLIDHGACLRFQYDWPAVTEDSPRRPGHSRTHLLDSSVDDDVLRAIDERLAPRLTREVLDAAAAVVPADFLGANAAMRAGYSAYLWKRLKAPRPFVEARP